MIKAVIVDDEPYASQVVSPCWEHCPGISVEAVCQHAKEAVKVIRDLKPGLVFLDIEMPHLNGFELLEMLAPVQFHVILPRVMINMP